MIPIYYIVDGKLNKGVIMTKDRLKEIEDDGCKEADRHFEKYPDATEDYLLGRRDGYIAALTDNEDKGVTIELQKQDIRMQDRQINELSLLVHRLCKMIEDNFIEGKPMDLKKAEEARSYIIQNFSAKNIPR